MKSAEEVIWWVLEAIKRELELQEYGLLTVISFDLEGLTSKDPNSPSIEDTRKAVYLLEKKYKILKIADIDNPKERKAHEKNVLDYRPSRGNATWFVFEMPDRTKFNEIYRKYEEKFPPGIEEVYYPEVIPDNTDELIKKAEQARIRQHKEVLAERRHRQDLKQKRILATKEDKFAHAINLIIERAEHQKTKSDSFSIDYHDFNFEDTMDNSRVLEGFLEKLKKVGAIKSYSRQNYSGGTRFGFRDVDVNRLKEYKVHGEKISSDGFSSPSSFPQKPPNSWRLEEAKGKAHIIKNDKTLFTFLYTWTDKYSYFKCAWQKYDQVVPYKKLYESKPERKYPNEKGKNWKVNDNIRATMRKLRKEFRNKKVPIVIETENGIRVFVQK